MAKKNFTSQSSPPTPSMSPTHTVTAKSVGIAKTPSSAEMDDDDDNDICPVCEGECTCAKLESSYQPKLPSLKIKLTVPATLRKTLSTSHGSAHLMMSDVEIDGGRTPTIPIAGPSQPKRRGRPPKIKSLLPGSVGPSHSTTQSTKPRARVTPAGRPTIKKNAAAIKKRKRARSSSAESSSSLSSLSASDPQNTASSHYPTFISASVIDSGPSSDSSASSDEEGQPADYSLDEATDSSIEAEEEQFILQNEQRMWKGKGKGRKGRKEEESKNSNKLRREKRRKEMLLSGKEREKRDHHHHNHDHFPFDANASDGASNDWVIRPRKSSFGGGAPDIPMRDLNGNSSTASSSLSSSGEASDDETAAEADEEPDDGDSKADDDEGTQEGKPRRYKRFATTWSMYTSSDEESSFDADMFFANLSDSSDDENSSCDEQCEMEGEDGDQSDLDGDSTMMSPPVHPMVLSGADALAATSFEVTEHWDGGIGFTNGEELGSSLFGNGFGFEGLGLGTPFQLNDQPRIREDGYFDVPVPSTDTAETSRSRSRSPDGYSSSNGGDTTDEDLIDSTSNLPNERAMNMFESPFKLPLHLESLHGVNPMNTVSPVRRGRKAFKAHALSPAPADILAGTTKEPWGRQYEDVDMDADEDVVMSGEALTPPSSGSHSRTRSIGGLPIAREFLLKDEATSLVIGSETKSIPSPYHRAKRERRRRRQGLRTMFGSDLLKRSSSVPPTVFSPSTIPRGSHSHSLSGVLDDFSVTTDQSVQESSASEHTADGPSTTAGTTTIELDDVLDSSFLDTDSSGSYPPFERSQMEVSDDDHANNDATASASHLTNLARWDTISVGAFRKTRDHLNEATSPTPKDYGDVIRSSPLNALWIQNQRAKPLSVFHSPLLLPTPADGERTPTYQDQQRHALLTRKETHYEPKHKKTKRKEYRKTPSRDYHSPKHHRHSPQHQYHPNKLSRNSSAQRIQSVGAMASGSVPPLTL